MQVSKNHLKSNLVVNILFYTETVAFSAQNTEHEHDQVHPSNLHRKYPISIFVYAISLFASVVSYRNVGEQYQYQYMQHLAL